MKMSNVHKIISFILILAMVFALSGCETYNNFKKAFIDPPTEEKTVIKVGILEPFTGRQSYDAEDEIAGMELAHSIFSSVNGHKIELVKADNRSSIDEVPVAAKTLIDSGVVCVLGSVSSSLSLAASDTLQEARIPAIAATNTVNILTSTNEYYFRACYTENFEERAAADFVISKIKSNELAKRQLELKKDETASITNEELLACVQSQAAIILTSNAGLSSAQIFEEKINSFFEINSQSSNEDTVTVYTLPDDPEKYEYFFANIADQKGNDAILYCPISLEAAQPAIEKSTSCYAFEWQEHTIINDPDETVENDQEVILVMKSLDATSEAAVYNFTFVGSSAWEGIENFDNVYYTKETAIDSINGSALVYTGNQTEEGLPEMTAASIEKTEIQKKFEDAYIKAYGEESLENVSDAFKLGFDSYYILYKTLEQIEDYSLLLLDNGSVNGTYLHRLMLRTKNLEILTKNLTFNSYGDPIKSIYIYGLWDMTTEELEKSPLIHYDEDGKMIGDPRVYKVVYVSTPNA